MRGTTAQAFEALINHVYHKNCELEKKSVEELFEVANIAEMYDVAGLMTQVGVAIARVPVTLSNVVELAHTAEQFSILISASQCLMSSCVTFLVSTLHLLVLDFSGLIFCSQHQDTAERLHKKILEIPLSLTCLKDDYEYLCICDHCDSIFVSKSALAAHLFESHGDLFILLIFISRHIKDAER